MKKNTENAFNLIEDLDIKDLNTPTTIDAGNSFFNIDFLTPPDEVEDPIIIPAKEEAPKDEEDIDTDIEDSEETEDAPNKVKVFELGDEQDYSDWSDFSLMALRQVKNGEWDLDEKEIPKDLDPITLMEMYDAQNKARVEKIQEEVLAKAGEFANYVEYRLKGGSPQVIDDALAIRQLTELDITEDENQKQVITALLEIKGIEDDVIEDTLETIFDKGKGKAKAQEAQEQLKKYEENLLKEDLKQRELQRQRDKENYDSYVKSVTDTVRSGKLGGIKIDKRKQDLIIDAMFKPTETLEVQNREGKKEKIRITKSKLLIDQLTQNPEKLASMVLWLLEGGDFEGIKEEIKEKKDDALREVLKGRKSGTVIKKQSSTTNGFEVLANRASQYDI